MSRRDTEHVLEVTGELALVGESDARGDIREREVAFAQKLLCPLDPAGDDVLVRRHPRGCFEPPCEVVGAQVGGRGHPGQGEVGVQVLVDVLDDHVERRSGQRAVRPTPGCPGRGGVADEVDREDICQGLDGCPPPSAISSSFTASIAARSSSQCPLDRARTGLPAGTNMIDPEAGGMRRVTPSNRTFSSSGGRAKRASI